MGNDIGMFSLSDDFTAISDINTRILHIRGACFIKCNQYLALSVHAFHSNASEKVGDLINSGSF